MQAGYAVIFLSRKGSAQPFVSDFQEDLGVQALTSFFRLGPGGQLGVNEGVEAGLAQAVRRAGEVERQGTYLHVPYSTLFEYLRVSMFSWVQAGDWLPSSGLPSCGRASGVVAAGDWARTLSHLSWPLCGLATFGIEGNSTETRRYVCCPLPCSCWR